MEFYVNNEKIDITLENEKTVGDVLKAFEVNCEENNAAVIGILVNGKQITADIFDEESKKELSSDMKIEVNVVTRQSIFDAFKKLSSLFRQLSDKVREIPVALQSGKDKEAHLSIKNLADSIETFCHLATLASLFEDFKEFKIDGKDFKEFFSDLSPVLSDFENALKDNDSVTVGDLAEYEISPRLLSIAQTLEDLC